MARPSDLAAEVAETEVMGRSQRNKQVQSQRRTEALTLRLAGLTYAQIGERLDITEASARDLIQRSLAGAEMRAVTALRDMENARLDRLQVAVWSKAIQGDIQAVDAVLRISQQRAKLNGLYAPNKLDVSVGVREEMNKALGDLESLVMESIPGEVVAEGESGHGVSHDDDRGVPGEGSSLTGDGRGVIEPGGSSGGYEPDSELGETVSDSAWDRTAEDPDGSGGGT